MSGDIGNVNDNDFHHGGTEDTEDGGARRKSDGKGEGVPLPFDRSLPSSLLLRVLRASVLNPAVAFAVVLAEATR